MINFISIGELLISTNFLASFFNIQHLDFPSSVLLIRKLKIFYRSDRRGWTYHCKNFGLEANGIGSRTEIVLKVMDYLKTNLCSESLLNTFITSTNYVYIFLRFYILVSIEISSLLYNLNDNLYKITIQSCHVKFVCVNK